MKAFRFSYFIVNNTTVIGEYTIRVKNGSFVKKEITQISLQHFYLFDKKDYCSAYLLYTDEKSKSKKLQVMATVDELGFLLNEFQKDENKLPINCSNTQQVSLKRNELKFLVNFDFNLAKI